MVTFEESCARVDAYVRAANATFVHIPKNAGSTIESALLE